MVDEPPLRSRAAREAAERALVRIVHHYGERPEFVVLGGLVPELLCAESGFQHAGTIDIDVQVDLEIACGAVNTARLERALRASGFTPEDARIWRWVAAVRRRRSHWWRSASLAKSLRSKRPSMTLKPTSRTWQPRGPGHTSPKCASTTPNSNPKRWPPTPSSLSGNSAKACGILAIDQNSCPRTPANTSVGQPRY